jgi:hypothetical protein
MIVPILTGLNAMTAANAFRGIEENRPRLAVEQPRRGHKLAVFLSQDFSRRVGHEASFAISFDSEDVSPPFCSRQPTDDFNPVGSTP